MYIVICRRVNMAGVDKQLPPDRNSVCVGCGTNVFCCDSAVLYYEQTENGK